jgi:hypothetical protein
MTHPVEKIRCHPERRRAFLASSSSRSICALALLLSSFAVGGGSAFTLVSSPSQRAIARHKTHASFQSTTSLLTPKVKWNQTPTVRRKPDCTI